MGCRIPLWSSGAVLPILLLFTPGSVQAAGPDWTRSAVNLPAPGTRFTLRHDLDGDGRRDLLVLTGDRLLIFPQTVRGQFASDPTKSIRVPESHPIVTLGRLAARAPSSLLFIGPSGIIERPRPLAPDLLESNLILRAERPFDVTTGTQPMLVDLAADLDGTGVDDLIIPFQDQFEILSVAADGRLQLRDALNVPHRTIRTAAVLPGVTGLGARYFEAARLHANPAIRSIKPSDTGANFLTLSVASALPRTLLVDWNSNHRLDVVTPSMVWQLEDNGTFNPVRIPGALNIFWSESALQNRVRSMANLADFNGDGRLDTFRIETVDNRLSPRTELEVYFARPDRTFSNRPDAVLRTRDISLSGSPAIGDLDGDGAPDVCLPHLDLQASSASSQFRSFLREGLRGELRFYCFDRSRARFPDAPTASVPLTVNYEMFGAAQLFRPLYAFHRDLDGDGQVDLVAKNSASTLAIHSNRGGRRGFETRPLRTLSVAPWQIADIEVVDLNQDAIGDIVATVYTPDSQRRLILAIFVSQGRP